MPRADRVGNCHRSAVARAVDRSARAGGPLDPPAVRPFAPQRTASQVLAPSGRGAPAPPATKRARPPGPMPRRMRHEPGPPLAQLPGAERASLNDDVDLHLPARYTQENFESSPKAENLPALSPASPSAVPRKSQNENCCAERRPREDIQRGQAGTGWAAPIFRSERHPRLSAFLPISAVF